MLSAQQTIGVALGGILGPTSCPKFHGIPPIFNRPQQRQPEGQQRQREGPMMGSVLSLILSSFPDPTDTVMTVSGRVEEEEG